MIFRLTSSTRDISTKEAPCTKVQTATVSTKEDIQGVKKEVKDIILAQKLIWIRDTTTRCELMSYEFNLNVFAYIYIHMEIIPG